jgi:hypothetical protein
MMSLKAEIRLLCLAIISPYMLVGQVLWPGDVNDNGIVNGIDMLYAGIAYGSTGPIRPGANENWEAQPLGTLWAQDFFDGINYAYADCDGNGEVNVDDVQEVIKSNFFLTHGTVTPDDYSTGMPGSSPPLRLVPQDMNVGLGATLVFDLLLGTEDMPVQDFYGIAISLSYNTDITFGGEWEFEEGDGVWYDPTEENSEELLAVDETAGKMELAITRIDQQSVNGSGKIGEFRIVVEDIVFGLVTDTLHLEIEKIRMIDKNFNTLSVVSESSYIVISRPTVTEDPNAGNSLRVFPNPAKENLTLAMTDHHLLSYEIRAMTGEVAYISSPLPSGTKAVQVPLLAAKLKPQLYLLIVHTTNGTLVEKFILI